MYKLPTNCLARFVSTQYMAMVESASAASTPFTNDGWLDLIHCRQ